VSIGFYNFLLWAIPHAHHVYLNLAPGLVTVMDVLKVLVEAIPIGAAQVMGPDTNEEPSIYKDFREILPESRRLERMGRFEFYEAARTYDIALAIATGEQRIYSSRPVRSRRIAAMCDVVSRSETMHRLHRRNFNRRARFRRWNTSHSVSK